MRVTVAASLEDYEVELAASAAEALNALASSDFAVVLCDLMMPEMTGAELFEALPSDSPFRERFVFMTGGGLPIGLQSFVALASPRVLDKPFTVAQLREVVASAAQESAPTSPRSV